MRKIQPSQIAVFLIILFLGLAASWVTTRAVFGQMALGDFRGLVLAIAAILFLYGYEILAYRAFLYAIPIKEGSIEPGTREEFAYHVYLLFYLILFYPIMRSGLVPVPLMRLVYIALGARLGSNTYSSGIILDPPFVTVGANCLIGQYALLVPHVIEGSKLAHFPIKIGDNVTIGAHAVVMSGVTIEENTIVATGAIVPKGTHIRSGEIWGGVPARRLRGKAPNLGPDTAAEKTG